MIDKIYVHLSHNKKSLTKSGAVVDQQEQLLKAEQLIAQTRTVKLYCFPFGKLNSEISVCGELHSRYPCPSLQIKKKKN